MFDVPVKKKILKHCEKQLDLYNFGKRGVADGNKQQQMIGIVGQSVVSDLFGLPLVDGSTGPDGGMDILYRDIKIDVKTMGRKVAVKPHYVNNFLSIQKHFPTDLYLFTSLNKSTNVLTVIGWTTKQAMMRDADFYKKGQFRQRDDGSRFRTFSDLFEVSNDCLAYCYSFDDLTYQLDLFSELPWGKSMKFKVKSGAWVEVDSEDIYRVDRGPENPGVTLRTSTTEAIRLMEKLLGTGSTETTESQKPAP
jgi:hypothetical protein